MSKQHREMVVLVLVLLSTLARAQWAQTAGPTGGDVFCFTTSGTDLLAGTYGGVFRSGNNGTTWEWASESMDYEVYALYARGSTLFAGILYEGGLFRSNDGGASWINSSTGLTSTTHVTAFAEVGSDFFVGTNLGVFKSTDGGFSWSAVNNGLTNTSLRSLVAKGTLLFAGTSGGLFVSSDNGASWVAKNTGLTNIVVNALAVSGSNVFAGTDATDGGVFLSIDNGENWTLMSNGLTNTWVRSLVVNGSNLFVGTWYNGGVFLSTDNGANWTSVSVGITDKNVHALAVSGTSVFAGTRGGVFRSDDNGTNWGSVNGTLANTFAYSLAIDGSNLFAGTYGSGVFLSTNNGLNWSAKNNGFGGDLGIRAFLNTGTLLIAGATLVYLSTDSGESWTESSAGLVGNTINALAAKGTDLFLGMLVSGVFRSTDNGASWTAVNNGLTNPSIRTLLVNGPDLYAGTNNGIFLSSNDGASWTEVSSGLTNTNVSSLAVIGTKLFAGTGYGVFLSSDAGNTWTGVNNGLGNDERNMTSLAVKGENLYAGTYRRGVFRSTNFGGDWIRMRDGLTNKRILALAINGKTLFAGTEGGAVWRIQDTLTGTAFNDLNGNGQRDPGDNGLSNWKVFLRDGTGLLVDSTLSDANGNYTFFEVPSGPYTLSEGLQDDWLRTYPGGEGTHTVVITAGNFRSGLDFGNTLGFKYIGPTGGQWSVGGNWTGNHPPTPDDPVLVPQNKAILVDALPSDSILYTRVVNGSALNFSNVVGRLKVKAFVHIESGATASFPSTNDSTGIVCYSDFVNKGTVVPGNSTFRFAGNASKFVISNESQTAGQTSFYNLDVVGDSTISIGNLKIGNVLTLSYPLSQRRTDTVFIQSASASAIVGAGKVSEGTVRRAIQPNVPTRYRFESESTYVSFTNGPYPTSVSVTSFPDSIPPTANWIPFGSDVTVDVENNVVHVRVVNPYRKWAIGIPRMLTSPNAPPQFVRRVYVMTGIGDTTGLVDLSLRYEQSELQPGMEESALTLFCLDVPPGPDQIRASVRLFLEGSFDLATSLMRTSLMTAGVLAAHFPNGLPIPAEAVDSITVEIRGAPLVVSAYRENEFQPVGRLPASNRKWSQPAWLLRDGTIRSYYDTTKSYVEYDTVAGSYHLVVRHRNHLSIMSATSRMLNSDTAIVYDFTTAQNQAWGVEPMKQVGTKFCMVAGDANVSAIVTAADANMVFGSLNATGYDDGDVNLSGIVSAADANVVFGNLNRSSQVPGGRVQHVKVLPLRSRETKGTDSGSAKPKE